MEETDLDDKVKRLLKHVTCIVQIVSVTFATFCSVRKMGKKFQSRCSSLERDIKSLQSCFSYFGF